MKKLLHAILLIVSQSTLGQNNNGHQNTNFNLGKIVLVKETQWGEIQYPPCISDAIKLHLKGDVFIVSQYDECLTCTDQEKERNFIYTQFSKDGQEIHKFDSPKNTPFEIRKHIHEWDTNGYISMTSIEDRNYNMQKVKKVIVQTITYLYDSIGNVISENHYKNYGDPYFERRHKYDKSCNLTETTQLDSSGKIEQIMQYLPKENCIRIFNHQNKVVEIRYVNQNMEIIKIEFPESKKPTLEYKYEYDERQNWIRKTCLVDQIQTEICHRDIQYYSIIPSTPHQKLSTVERGGLNWTKTNLQVKNFRNGDIIPQAKSYMDWWCALLTKTPAWCYSDPGYGRTISEVLYNSYAIKDTRQLAPPSFRVATYDDWQNLFGHWGGINKSFRILHDNQDKKFNSDCMLGHRSGWHHMPESGWWTAEKFSFILAVDDPGEEEINSMEELGESWGIYFEKNTDDNWSDGYLVRCVRE
jgi:hypothetical protein